MTAPISCIVTSFNNRTTIRAAVESVLRQTLPVSEILIADDASSDGSRELITALAREYCNVRPVLREQNVGVAANRDLAMRSASQPFVTHLDGDDLFAPDKLQAEWRALVGRTDAIAYSLIARFSPGEWWRTQVLNPFETVGVRGQEFDRLLARSGAIPRDMLLSRKLYESAGGFTHGMPLYEDWDFKLRLALTSPHWVPTGVIGTVYFHREGSLSKAASEHHLYWRARVSAAAQDEAARQGLEPSDFSARRRLLPIKYVQALATNVSRLQSRTRAIFHLGPILSTLHKVNKDR